MPFFQTHCQPRHKGNRPLPTGDEAIDSDRLGRDLAEGLYADWQTAHPETCLAMAMHYNDYVTDTEAWRALFAFLGEPFDPERVQATLARKLMHMKWQRPQA